MDKKLREFKEKEREVLVGVMNRKEVDSLLYILGKMGISADYDTGYIYFDLKEVGDIL